MKGQGASQYRWMCVYIREDFFGGKRKRTPQEKLKIISFTGEKLKIKRIYQIFVFVNSERVDDERTGSANELHAGPKPPPLSYPLSLLILSEYLKVYTVYLLAVSTTAGRV